MKIIKKIKKFFKSKFYVILPNCINANEWKIKPTDKFLILAPHPDDESIGCGGLLIKYASQCDICLLTNGCHGDPKIEPSKMAKIRFKEFESVMKALKVNSYMYLDIEDGKLIENLEKFKQINLNSYDYILIPSPHDMHCDHMAVSVLLNKIKSKKFNGRIVHYEIWSTIKLPTHYIDISDVIEKKRKIINMYKSQIKHIDYASRITGLNHYRGILHNLQYEEDYEVI